ncbi:MAG: class I SAM-dependent methyltransferase [Clostridiales Family XIII bacterium]|jgi:SAM-dependent methyltransferase|nr:class I SAM-dependent methyltransferase [Clostridiales Family XIII bacterium]
MKKWLERRAEQYEAASKWTGFYDNIRDKILLSLHKENTGEKSLVDIGCGIGILDRKLSPYFKNIVAIDKDSNAIKFFLRKINEERLTNIKTITKRWEQVYNQYKNNKRDILLLSFFSDPRIDNMEKLFSFAKEKVVIVTNAGNDLRENDSRKREKRLLERANGNIWIKWIASEMNNKSPGKCKILSYEKQELDFDFGQPLHSKNEAFLFIKDYYEIEIAKKRIKDLEKTGDEKFPYFLPKTKHLTIIIINLKMNS